MFSRLLIDAGAERRQPFIARRGDGTKDHASGLLPVFTEFAGQLHADYFAEHSRRFSHDLANRYLAGERITPRLVWEKVCGQVVPSEKGYAVFDDTVLEQCHSSRIGLVRRQYSGNAKSVIKGIGVINCVHVNPETQQFWIIGYHIHDPDGDGKSKLHHVKEMPGTLAHRKQLDFKAVLMDSWYAAKWLIFYIDRTYAKFC